jgi:putative alpha-1,2-mannosidase
VIEARNNSKKNIYIESLELNGEEHPTFHLDLSEVVKGGKMVVTLSDQPAAD